MKCSLCGCKFTEEEGKKSCPSCIVKNCDMVKCPNCGYDNPIEPKFIKFFKKWVRKWR